MTAITEPTTLATDYLLAAFSAVLAMKLWAAGTASARWWALAFAMTAIAGAAGGTVHGFQLLLPATVLRALWLLTLELLVAAGAAILLATAAVHARSTRAHRRIAAGVGLASVGYMLWLPARPAFASAIAAYGCALVVLALVEARAWRSWASPASGWLLAGVGVSVVAAVVQQGGWSLHRHFNHNDLYHVVQAGALWLLYRGARLQPAWPPARHPRAIGC